MRLSREPWRDHLRRLPFCATEKQTGIMAGPIARGAELDAGVIVAVDIMPKLPGQRVPGGDGLMA